jgi:selenium-binding protein 1
LYFTTSLLANWDGVQGDDAQFLKAYDWDGKQLSPRFEIDFRAEKLGRPHIMNFGQAGLYKTQARQGAAPGEPG